MNNRLIGTVLVFALVFGLTGCSGTWRKKFVRRKKDEDKQGPVLQPKDYRKEFTNHQLYANHYAFWKNAELELISSIKSSKSQKRIKVQSSYSLIEIEKLHELLIEEKQKELAPLIEQLREIVTDISKPHYIASHKNTIVRDLTRHYRAVSMRFSYYHMKKYIRPDTEEAPEAETEESHASTE